MIVWETKDWQRCVIADPVGCALECIVQNRGIAEQNLQAIRDDVGTYRLDMRGYWMLQHGQAFWAALNERRSRYPAWKLLLALFAMPVARFCALMEKRRLLSRLRHARSKLRLYRKAETDLQHGVAASTIEAIPRLLPKRSVGDFLSSLIVPTLDDVRWDALLSSRRDQMLDLRSNLIRVSHPMQPA